MIFSYAGISNIVCSNQELDFPKQIDMNETDVFTQEAFKNLFKLSYEKRIPEYLIGITQFKKDENNIYHFYDGLHLLSHYCDKNEKLDPLTNVTIEKVHYFATKCYCLNSYSKEETELEIEFFKPHFLVNSEVFIPILKRHSFNDFAQFQRWIFSGLNPHWKDQTIKRDGYVYTDREKIIAKVSCVLFSAAESEKLSSIEKSEFRYIAVRWAYCGQNAFILENLV